MKTIISRSSIWAMTAAMLISSVALAQTNRDRNRPHGAPLAKMVRVDLPCTVQAAQIGTTNKYNVKLVATNNTNSWLPEGRKINYTYGPTMKGAMVLDQMLPISSKFTVRQFQYTAEPLAPTTYSCSAYYYYQAK